MTQKEIDKILLNVAAHGILVSKAVKEIYKLHLEDKIKLLVATNSDDYWMDKLAELEQELKTLEGE